MEEFLLGENGIQQEESAEFIKRTIKVNKWKILASFAKSGFQR